MSDASHILGVYLSATYDLEAYYGEAISRLAPDVVVCNASAVDDPEQVRFAVCWEPGPEDFAPFPNLEMAMSVAAGVDALLWHPALPRNVAISRVRDPHQAALMAGYAAHEVLHYERRFGDMADNAGRAEWKPMPMRAPVSVTVAVLGHGTMGQAIACSLSALGFSIQVACRNLPAEPQDDVVYFTGPDAISQAAAGADHLINVLPLTAETRNVLDRHLFAKMAPGASLIQIGRGEHLVDAELIAALNDGHLRAATLDVFRQEPLPPDHPFWTDARLRLTPHVASTSSEDVVAEQVTAAARAVRDGRPIPHAVDRRRGY